MSADGVARDGSALLHLALQIQQVLPGTGA